jgi:hypothetical protein
MFDSRTNAMPQVAGARARTVSRWTAGTYEMESSRCQPISRSSFPPGSWRFSVTRTVLRSSVLAIAGVRSVKSGEEWRRSAVKCSRFR